MSDIDSYIHGPSQGRPTVKVIAVNSDSFDINLLNMVCSVLEGPSEPGSYGSGNDSDNQINNEHAF